MRRFAFAKCHWVPLPGEIELSGDIKTFRQLFEYVTSTKRLRKHFPVSWYTINKGYPTATNNNVMAIFEHWENTVYRHALIDQSGTFSWDQTKTNRAKNGPLDLEIAAVGKRIRFFLAQRLQHLQPDLGVAVVDH